MAGLPSLRVIPCKQQLVDLRFREAPGLGDSVHGFLHNRLGDAGLLCQARGELQRGSAGILGNSFAKPPIQRLPGVDFLASGGQPFCSRRSGEGHQLRKRVPAKG